MLAIAMASYLSVYPILLLPPIILLCLACQSASMTTGAVDALQAQGPAADSRTNGAPVPKNQQSTISTVLLKAPKTETRSFLRAVAKCVTSFGAALWALIFVSYLLLGQSWDFLSSVYGVHVLLPDLTPNVGLWWYFFIEIFDAFREFFLGVFWLHLASYSAGLSIRLYAQPLAAVIALMGLSAVFKPYPSVGDAALFLSMLPIYSHVFPLRRYSFVGWTALAYSAFLGPAFHYLWIYAGSGNANFFYAITLVWSLGLGIIIADFIYACLRDEWEVERPEMRGREAKQI